MDTITAPPIRDLSKTVAFSARRFSPEGDEETDYRNAFEAMAQRGVDAILLSEQAVTHRRLLVELAKANKLPTMTPWIDIVKIGGLIAYAPDRVEAYQYLAASVDRILIGKNPGEIPDLSGG